MRDVFKNAPLRRFFVTMFLVYAAWFVVYDLWLLPDGRLDAWLSMNIATVSAQSLALLGFEATAQGRLVTMPGGAGILIENGCNGLSTISLFVGFVVAFPGLWRRRAWFIPLGILVIYLTNVFRCVSLLWLQVHWPSMFGSVHGFHALFIFYVVVFLLWMAWANYGGQPGGEAPPAAPPTGSPATPALT